MRRLICVLVWLACCSGLRADDSVIAEFDGDDYGDWIVSGEAFGDGPARGGLGGQMAVSGFQGKGLPAIEADCRHRSRHGIRRRTSRSEEG